MALMGNLPIEPGCMVLIVGSVRCFDNIGMYGTVERLINPGDICKAPWMYSGQEPGWLINGDGLSVNVRYEGPKVKKLLHSSRKAFN